MRPSLEYVLNAFGIGSSNIEFDETFTHSDKITAVSNICINIPDKKSLDRGSLPGILRQAGCSDETIKYTICNLFYSSNLEDTCTGPTIEKISMSITVESNVQPVSPKMLSTCCCLRKCFREKQVNR